MAVGKVVNKRQSQVHPRTSNNNFAIEYPDDVEHAPIDTDIFSAKTEENTVIDERDVRRSRSEEQPLIGSEQPMAEEAQEEVGQPEVEEKEDDVTNAEVKADEQEVDKLADVTEAEQNQEEVMTSHKTPVSRPVSRMTRKSVASAEGGATVLPGQVVAKTEDEQTNQDMAQDAPDCNEPETPTTDDATHDDVTSRAKSAVVRTRDDVISVADRPGTSAAARASSSKTSGKPRIPPKYYLTMILYIPW